MIKKFFISILIVIVSALIGYLLLSLVYCIPRDGLIRTHAQLSAVELSSEQEFDKVMRGLNSALDDYTECVMLQEATATQDVNPFVDSLANKYTGYTADPREAFIQSFTNGSNGSDFNITSYGRY